MSGSGTKRTSPSALHMSAYDPKRTSGPFRPVLLDLNHMQSGRVSTVKWNTSCKLPASVLEPAPTAAASWNGKRALIASGRRQKSTFSCAAAATTFVRWNAKLPRAATNKCVFWHSTGYVGDLTFQALVVASGSVVPTVDQNKSGAPDPAHPICPTCKVAMWLTEVGYFGSADKPEEHLIYECPVCRSKTVTPPLGAA